MGLVDVRPRNVMPRCRRCRCGVVIGSACPGSMVRIRWLGVQRWVDCRLAHLMGIGRAHMLFGSHPVDVHMYTPLACDSV